MRSIRIDIDLRGQFGSDRLIAELAERQHGVVARRQLLALGFERGAIDRRVAMARLHPLHRGVYAVGHRVVSLRGRWVAAVLACGAGALLSHRSAAALWDLLPLPGGRIDVSAFGGRRLPGVATHRPRRLGGFDHALHDGIPVTSVSRTLVDLAAVVTQRQLARAAEQAELLGLLDLRAIERILDRYIRRPGLPALRRVLGSRLESAPTIRSELERHFLSLCAETRLPAPAVNTFVEGFEVDAVWRNERLIVELDGYRYHSTHAAFERDRARDAALQVAGYRVIRITANRLGSEEAAVLSEIRLLLAA